MRNSISLTLICLTLIGCYSTISVESETVSPLYLPTIVNTTSLCESMNFVESTFSFLLVTDAEQQRPILQCDERLMRTAQQVSDRMAFTDTFSHCHEGICPNTVVRNSGCILPAHYGDTNNVESIVAGTKAPWILYTALRNSDDHRNHILGIGDFYRQQNLYGVGFTINAASRYKFYLAVHISECEN